MLLDHLTMKVEYLYIDLRGQTATLVSPPPSTPGVFMNYHFNADEFSLLRGGLNYKF